MEQIVNMRDLGGLINQAGLQIKPNMLFRSGNPAKASENDCEKLTELKLQQLIDFRCPSEKHESEHAFATRFNWVAQPISVGNMVELLNDKFTKDTAYQAMCSLYRRLPVEFQTQYKYLLSQAELGQCLLYHCTAGKDRTGFASLLLLSALGVDYDAIMTDYLASNQAMAGLKKQVVTMQQSLALDADALDILLGVQAVYLENSMDVINKQFGGVDRYLTHTLAVDVDRIKSHYLQS